MKKNFFRRFLALMIASQFYFSYTWAQNLPTDPPPVEPPIDTPPGDDPTDPVTPPELVKTELSEADSKELFDVLTKWEIIVTDRQTQTKHLNSSDLICVENMEDGRRVGCSLYDELRSRPITKYNKFADPLFKLMVKHFAMECEDDSETCVAAAEKVICTLSMNKYTCSVEFYSQQPKRKLKHGDLK